MMVSHEHSQHQHMAKKALRLAFFFTIAILIVEAVAGYLANSLALMSDAGHILTDAAALGLAWLAVHLAEMPPDERATFGYRRSTILAALGNAALLLVVVLAIAAEAVVRLRHPQHVTGAVVIIAAALAIVVNSYIAVALRGGGDENLNIRAALLHVVSDIAASVGVIISGVIVLVWHAYLADPIISLFIGLLIAYGAWQIVRDTVVILMEGTPRGLELEQVQAAMREVPGVEEIHDLHVWALSDGFRLLSAHVMVPNQSLADGANLLADLKLILHRRFHIEHATIELECSDCRMPPRRTIELQEPKLTERSG